MPAFRTILLATDFSPASHRAFEIATALAGATTTRLHLLYVLEPPSVAGELGVRFPVEDPEPTRQALLQRLRDQYVPERPVECAYEVLSGAPAATILERAGTLGADLIVLGTHGRSGLARWVAGSVAEAVLRQAQVPVLAFRDPHHDIDEVAGRAIHSRAESV